MCIVSELMQVLRQILATCETQEIDFTGAVAAALDTLHWSVARPQSPCWIGALTPRLHQQSLSCFAPDAASVASAPCAAAAAGVLGRMRARLTGWQQRVEVVAAGLSDIRATIMDGEGRDWEMCVCGR